MTERSEANDGIGTQSKRRNHLHSIQEPPGQLLSNNYLKLVIKMHSFIVRNCRHFLRAFFLMRSKARRRVSMKANKRKMIGRRIIRIRMEQAEETWSSGKEIGPWIAVRVWQIYVFGVTLNMHPWWVIRIVQFVRNEIVCVGYSTPFDEWMTYGKYCRVSI